MSKERPNPDKFANELAVGSAFFRKRVDEPKPATDAPSSPGQMAEAAPKSEPVRPVRVVKRQMIRHPFELYMDQLERLRALAEEQRRSGGVGSMSRMVREAIDRYLDEQSS
jgi:hypothetical protein